MPEKFEYKNKTALVTGASSGFGKEFAKQLAARGANLVISSRREKVLWDVAGDIREKIGGQVEIEVIAEDLSKPDAPNKIFNHLKEKKINVDLLINNAGFGRYGSFHEEPFDDIFNMNMVNMVNLASMCHLFIKSMLEKGGGGILNVASTASFQSVPYMADYAATKAFVLSLTNSLWQEYKNRGMYVMALCPGFSKTGFLEDSRVSQKVLNQYKILGADEVVKGALDEFAKGEPIFIPPPQRDFLQLTLSKFIPLKMKLQVTGDMFKPE